MGVYRRTYTKAGQKHVSRFWYCVDPTDGREKSLRVTDKAIAEVMLGELRRARELRRAGIETFDSARRAKPLDLLEEYVTERARTRAAPRTLTVIRYRLGWFLSRVASIGELTQARIGAILDERRWVKGHWHASDAPEQPLGANSYNQYLETLGSFFRWLVKHGRWHMNPVDAIKRATIRGAAFERWALTVEQLQDLVEKTPVWRGAVYALAANTGLRRGELEQLNELADLDLEAGKIRVLARITKANSDDSWLPLNPWTVEVLRRYLEAVPPDRRPPRFAPTIPPRGKRLFTAVPTVRTLHRDLKKYVGVQPVNAAGEVFDLHALRTTFGTLLARAKVAPQVAKDLMRHSDIRLTLKSYTKLTLHDHREAVATIQPKKAKKPGHRGLASG